MSNRFLPDKAIDLIDEAASNVRMRATQGVGEETGCNDDDDECISVELSLAERIRQFQNRVSVEASRMSVTAEDVAKIISRSTGIEITAITGEETQRLLDLEERLKARVKGQDEAVSAIAKAIRRGRVGLKDPNRPICSFLFLGPTGVGKTEICRALSNVLFGNDEAMLRLDMSEFMEKQWYRKLSARHQVMSAMMTAGS